MAKSYQTVYRKDYHHETRAPQHDHLGEGFRDKRRQEEVHHKHHDQQDCSHG